MPDGIWNDCVWRTPSGDVSFWTEHIEEFDSDSRPKPLSLSGLETPRRGGCWFEWQSCGGGGRVGERPTEMRHQDNQRWRGRFPSHLPNLRETLYQDHQCWRGRSHWNLSQKDAGNWYVRTTNIPTVGGFFNLTLSLNTADEVIPWSFLFHQIVSGLNGPQTTQRFWPSWIRRKSKNILNRTAHVYWPPTRFRTSHVTCCLKKIKSTM